MYKNRVKSHHFTKHTRLDFSRFVLDPDGIPQPKLSDGEEEKLAMMDNPDYKWWYKYFTSNKIPEKIPTKALLEQKKKSAHVNNNNTGPDRSLTKEETDPKKDPANQIVKVKYDTNSEAIVNIANIKAKSKARTKKGLKFKGNPPPATPSDGVEPGGTDAGIRLSPNFETGPKPEPEPEPERPLSGTHSADPTLGVTKTDARGAAGVLPAVVTDWPSPPNDLERPQAHNVLPSGPNASGGRDFAGGTWTNGTGPASAAVPGHIPGDVSITTIVCNGESTDDDGTSPATGQTFERAHGVGLSAHQGEQPLQPAEDTMHPINQMGQASRPVTHGTNVTDVAVGGTAGSTVGDQLYRVSHLKL